MCFLLLLLLLLLFFLIDILQVLMLDLGGLIMFVDCLWGFTKFVNACFSWLQMTDMLQVDR